MNTPLFPSTCRLIADIFQSLDYAALGPIYCDEGGDLFWADRREPCEQLGLQMAATLRARLPPQGRSLYVGAGVAEIPVLIMETVELQRDVAVYNLHDQEVAVLNAACHALPFRFEAKDARSASGTFDHIWMVSVLNDPAHFPELSDLSYGRADPVTFDPTAFSRERDEALSLATTCLNMVTLPGLVTISVEEIPWVTHWSRLSGKTCIVEDADYPTALVGDPICLVRVE